MIGLFGAPIDTEKIVACLSAHYGLAQQTGAKLDAERGAAQQTQVALSCLTTPKNALSAGGG
jgi:hypothetical protein